MRSWYVLTANSAYKHFPFWMLEVFFIWHMFSIWTMRQIHTRPSLLKVIVYLSLVSITSVLITSIILSKINDKSTDGPEPSFVTVQDLDWWKWTPIYQIYPRSFQDSDGDGTGDLTGIKNRVPYLCDLGIKAVWLSPVYESPMADFGYDISNFTKIDPLFGSMQDFHDLVHELHKHGMYLIMDFVPNHTSDQHYWFQQSLLGKEPYNDYYIWRDEPNNWLSAFGNSSWEYKESRKAYYMHRYLIQQPDLNYRNPKVRQEMNDILRFWVDQGVDGFRIDAVRGLIEDAQFRDEPRSGLEVPANHHRYLNHVYTCDQQETYQIVREWTDMLRKYGAVRHKYIFICTEAYTDPAHVMQYYKTGVDFPFNFNLIRLNSRTTPTDLRGMINAWMNFMSAGSWPNWVIGNHDQRRVASRLGGRKYIDIANMLLLMLPGTPTVYNGDEIGMIDADITYEQAVDPAGRKWGPDTYMKYTRDPERSPMQWDTSQNAGFTKGKTTWLPLGPDWQTYNVEVESEDPNSHLGIFKALVKLRQKHVFRLATNLRLINVQDETIFAFTRELNPESSYLIVLNFGHNGRKSSIDYGMATGAGKIVIRSANAGHKVGEVIWFNRTLEMEDAEGYVIKLL